MKRTDEMKLGEDLRGFCDCNQGRLLCTCYDRTAELCRRNLVNVIELDERLNQLLNPTFGTFTVDPASIRLNDEPLLPPTTEYPSDRRKNPIERFSVAAQLQLMKALAILGWAAFILELLRV